MSKSNSQAEPKAAGKMASKRRVRRRISKQLQIVRHLERPNGASIAQLAKATGWQAPSIRAALTGLRKKGHNIVRARDDRGISRYRLSQLAD